MSQPSVELTLEVNIFERLEQLTEANLGTLTRLRIKSRSERVNLLFLAYQERIISAPTADEMAQVFGINTAQAPWAHELSLPHQSLPTTHGSSLQRADPLPKPARRFSERASLTEALHNAIQPSISPFSSQPSRQLKRGFADQDLKTEIEINLPASMEDNNFDSSQAMTKAKIKDALTPSTSPHFIRSRYSALERLDTPSHLGLTIYRYLHRDHVLARDVQLISSYPIDSLKELKILDQYVEWGGEESPLENYLRACQHGLTNHSSLLEVYRRSQSNDLAFTKLAPQGQTVMEVLQEQPEGERRQVINEILRQLCLVINHAHQNKISHRNLRATSLYLLHGELIVHDWEWSKLILREDKAEQQVSHPQMLGARSQGHISLQGSNSNTTWLAPELRNYDSITGEEWMSVDIYSMALLAVYLFTREHPAERVLESPLALEEWLFTHLSHQTTSTYINTCRRALSTQPEQRPKSARELYRLLFDEVLIS